MSTPMVSLGGAHAPEKGWTTQDGKDGQLHTLALVWPIANLTEDRCRFFCWPSFAHSWDEPSLTKDRRMTTAAEQKRLGICFGAFGAEGGGTGIRAKHSLLKNNDSVQLVIRGQLQSRRLLTTLGPKIYPRRRNLRSKNLRLANQESADTGRHKKSPL